MVQIRVLIPFLSFFSKVFFCFTFLVNANDMLMMLNVMIKCLITLLQKWDVTQVQEKQEEEGPRTSKEFGQNYLLQVQG